MQLLYGVCVDSFSVSNDVVSDILVEQYGLQAGRDRDVVLCEYQFAYVEVDLCASVGCCLCFICFILEAPCTVRKGPY